MIAKTIPCVEVTYFNGKSIRVRFFESYPAAERFMDYCDMVGFHIEKVAILK